MAKLCLLLLLLAGLCLPGYTQKKTISVIGSSTAEGFGLPDAGGNPLENMWSNEDNNLPVNSWVNRLARYYTGLNLLNSMNNFSIYGQDIYQAQATGFVPQNSTRPLPEEDNNITKALSVNPDIILINYPSNNYDVNGYGIHEVMRLFRRLYRQAIANGHTVCYISTSQPRTSVEYDMAGRQKLRTLRDSILTEFPGHAIDFYTPIVDSAIESSPGVPNDNYLGIKPEYGQGDGIHLNETGHLQLFNAVLAMNIVPIAPLPLKLGSVAVKRIDDTHITVSFTVLDGNTEKQFFIWVKDKAGNTKSVRVIIPDKTKSSQTISETIQIY
jgi:hypothetical protein